MSLVIAYSTYEKKIGDVGYLISDRRISSEDYGPRDETKVQKVTNPNDINGFIYAYVGDVPLELYFKYLVKNCSSLSDPSIGVEDWWFKSIGAQLMNFRKEGDYTGSFVLAYKGSVYTENGEFVQKVPQGVIICEGEAATFAYGYLACKGIDTQLSDLFLKASERYSSVSPGYDVGVCDKGGIKIGKYEL